MPPSATDRPYPTPTGLRGGGGSSCGGRDPPVLAGEGGAGGGADDGVRWDVGGTLRASGGGERGGRGGGDSEVGRSGSLGRGGQRPRNRGRVPEGPGSGRCTEGRARFPGAATLAGAQQHPEKEKSPAGGNRRGFGVFREL